ncbi:MAG: glucosamine-6-phosphate deaminase [Chthoniobacterales bacterium]
MEVIIQPTAEAASEIAARLVAKQVTNKPDSVLGLATGSTPCRLYEILAKRHKHPKAGTPSLDFSKVTTFNLDEYVGLAPEHEASYHYFMQENFFDHVNVPAKNIHIPDGMTDDIPAFCQSYEEKIAQAGGIDLQLLGLGSDGHIGFNEPISSFSSRTRIKTLSEITRRDNARFFNQPEDVPHHVITMGIGTIMDSKMCLLLAFGESKADAVAATVEGPIAANVPGSILQFHPSAKIILDEAAASRLDRSDYYRWVYSGKPDWQIDL